MHRKVSIVALVAALALLVPVLAGCGSRASDAADESAPASVRTPQPTFTPTPLAGAVVAADAQALSQAPLEAAPLESAALAAPVDAAAAALAAPAAASDIAAPTATPQPEQPGFGGPVTPPPAPAAPPPLGIVNTELVNSRSGPDTTFQVVIVLGRGEEYDVTGKSADGGWWRLCCVENKDVWAKAEFVDVASATDTVPVAQAGEVSAVSLAKLNAESAPAADAAAQPEAPAAVASAPTAAPTAIPAPTAAPAPAANAVAEAAPVAPPAPASEVVSTAEANSGDGAHALVASERFPETNVVRVFLYVYQGSEALAGYSLRVTREGIEQTVSGASFGGMAGLSWPIADERQRFQNFKAEFPGVEPAGTWTVELVKDGVVVGPAATFTLSDNDTSRELYVRYERK